MLRFDPCLHGPRAGHGVLRSSLRVCGWAIYLNTTFWFLRARAVRDDEVLHWFLAQGATNLSATFLPLRVRSEATRAALCRCEKKTSNSTSPKVKTTRKQRFGHFG